MKYRKEYLKEFVEEHVEPVLEPFLAGELEVDYENSKDNCFIVKTPSAYTEYSNLFGGVEINFHASHANLGKFGKYRSYKNGMPVIACNDSGINFRLVFKFTKVKLV